jgi:DNA uptake protein ComE-like DNA-binding protein
LKTRFINYLHFSRNERLGTFALLTFCTLAFSVPTVVQWFRPRTQTDFSALEAALQKFKGLEISKADKVALSFDFDPNLASLDELKQLGLAEKVAQNICRYREKGGSFRKPEDFKKIWSLNPEDFERLQPYIHIGMDKNESTAKQASLPDPEYFPFDPNTASAEDFKKLGLPERTINGILNYRSKGGVFRKKEDFAKIYTLNESDYQRLAPYITLATTSDFALRPTTYSGGALQHSLVQKTNIQVDMNAADAATWMSLPLIGEKRAQQIVNFREKLGGFRSIDQLAEMYNLPDSVFQAIRPQLILKTTALHKININTVTLEALDAHPYISKKQADLIIAYRSQHGPFSQPGDVLKIKAFTDKSWWDKVAPYLSVE